MSNASAIVISDLVIKYGQFTAVSNISFDVAVGETFGLLGPNGAGKTTTFLCLTGQISNFAGSVQLLGWDLRREFNLIKSKTGYVPDQDNHLEDFTAYENLKLFADLYNVPQPRVMECLELVELVRERDLPVGAFSKGMKKKLLIARELLHEPRLLLLDEPTANLDVHSTQLIREIIKNLAKQKVTILITTHNMREVEEVCQRVAIINHGKLIELDTPMGFKTRNTAHVVDMVLKRNNEYEKESVDLNDESQRQHLAQVLTSEIPVTLHTREFNFNEVFLKITGEKYN